MVQDLLSDPEASVRRTAAEAFLARGQAAQAAAPDVFALCRAAGVWVSRSLVIMVQKYRSEADLWIPRLRAMLAEEEEDSRQSAALWLRAFGPVGEEALREALSDPDERVRIAARYGLDALIE